MFPKVLQESMFNIGMNKMLVLQADESRIPSMIASRSTEVVMCSVSSEFDEQCLLERYRVSEHGTEVIEGPLMQALKRGGILVVRSAGRIPDRIRTMLLSVACGESFMNPLTGEVIEVPDSFRVIGLQH